MNKQKTSTVIKRILIIFLISIFLIVSHVHAYADYYDFGYKFDPPTDDLVEYVTSIIGTFLLAIGFGMVLVLVFYLGVCLTGGVFLLAVFLYLYFIYIEIPSKVGWRVGYTAFCVGSAIGMILGLFIFLVLGGSLFKREEECEVTCEKNTGEKRTYLVRRK